MPAGFLQDAFLPACILLESGMTDCLIHACMPATHQLRIDDKGMKTAPGPMLGYV